MDNQKYQAALDKYNETIEKTKPIALKSIIGQWAVQCLREGAPLNPSTLRSWAQSSTLQAGDKLVIDELLEEISQ